MVDPDANEEQASDVSIETNGWQPVPLPKVFRQVSLLYRRVPSDSCGADLPRPCHGAVSRSFCRVQLWPGADAGASEEEASTFEFVVGELEGHRCPHGSPADERGRVFHPPMETDRIDVPPWVTEAVLVLPGVGAAADFEATATVDTGSDAAPAVRTRLRLLDASPARDLLGDGGILLRVLDVGTTTGVKPRDLARVRASWQVWFKRNGESVLSLPADAGGTEFVLDDGKLMVAMELGLKDMASGTRAVLRISEEWGQGPLSPQGNPSIRGAALWVEMTLHSVKNEPGPGEHEDMATLLAFALEKKQQGNTCLVLDSVAEHGRALRRYEVSLAALESVLPFQFDDSLQPALSQPSAPDAESGWSKLAPLAIDDERLTEVKSLRLLVLLNAAQAQLKRRHWREAASFCDAALRQESNPKGYYRRAQARTELGDLTGAVDDLRAALLLIPGDAGILRELARVAALQKKHCADEKKTFGGFFDKMKQKEDERAQREEARQKAEADAKEASAQRAREEAREHAAKHRAEAAAATPAPAVPAPPVATEASAESEQESADRQVKELLASLDKPSAEVPPPVLPELPPSMQSKTTGKPEPVDYEVPSFLRRSKGKKTP